MTSMKSFLFATLLCAEAILARPSLAQTPKFDAQDQKVVAALTKNLRERVSSPGGKLKLVVKPTARADAGYFSEVRVEGFPVYIKKLRVSELALVARNVRVDVPYLLRTGKVRTLSSSTKLRAVITEDDLTSMLSKGKHSQSMGLKVKYQGTQLLVTGNLNWTLINGPVSGVGQLRMAPGHLVFLDIVSLKLRGVEVPQFVKNQFSNKINPVINYEDLPFNPPFKGVKVVGGKAIVTT